MADVKLISMGEEYLEDIMEIEHLSFAIPWSREAFRQEILHNQLARYQIAIEGGRAIAYGGIWLILDEAHITNIAVHPDYRGKGVGKKLIEDLIETAQKKGMVQMTLEVRKSNKVAIHLYESFGFEIAGVRKGYYADNHEDALIMWKWK